MLISTGKLCIVVANFSTFTRLSMILNLANGKSFEAAQRVESSFPTLK